MPYVSFHRNHPSPHSYITHLVFPGYELHSSLRDHGGASAYFRLTLDCTRLPSLDSSSQIYSGLRSPLMLRSNESTLYITRSVMIPLTSVTIILLRTIYAIVSNYAISYNRIGTDLPKQIPKEELQK